MHYKNLNELISHSQSSRKYFLSLQPDLQASLHMQNDYIRSAAALHARAEALKSYERSVNISNMLL